MHACMHILTHMHTHIHTDTHAYKHTHTLSHTHMHACTHTHRHTPCTHIPSIRHNGASLDCHILTDVCHDVKVESDIQPLNNEVFHHKTANIQPQLDTSMKGFCGCRYKKIYIDAQVFNPFAPSNSSSSLQSCYRKHESVTKWAYKARIREV